MNFLVFFFLIEGLVLCERTREYLRGFKLIISIIYIKEDFIFHSFNHPSIAIWRGRFKKD